MLADALEIDLAWRIEGFDVSHAQGKRAVGNVTFVDGSAEKRATIAERSSPTRMTTTTTCAPSRWRASRAVEERDDRPDPDLLLIDGGEGNSRLPATRSRRSTGTCRQSRCESRGARGHAPPNVLVAERRAAPAPPPARARRGSPLRRAVPPDYSRRGQDGVRRRAGESGQKPKAVARSLRQRRKRSARESRGPPERRGDRRKDCRDD